MNLNRSTKPDLTTEPPLLGSCCYTLPFYEFNLKKNMNAKEKAKEIYCKYADALNIRDLQATANPFAKQCALIAVEEILHCEATEPSDTDWDDCGATAQYYWPQKKVDAGKFWGDVKSELQSL